MRSVDWDKLALLEREISERYGQEVAANIRSFWNDEKEQEYKKIIKDVYEKIKHNRQNYLQDENGILYNKRLLNRQCHKVCTKCQKYTFLFPDSYYIDMHDVCERCYIKFLEGREK